MAKFHISVSGEPNLCTAAEGNCPLSDADEHFSSPEEARTAYEAENVEDLMPPPLKRGALSRKQAIELDQFFTKDELSEDCLKDFDSIVESLGYDRDKIHFVEPSAGGGSFVRAASSVFPDRPVVQGDIQPKNDEVHQLDFLNDDVTPLLQGDKEHRVVIGNPPFGYRGKLAADFINKGLEISDTVVFVIPIQFQKWSAQREIASDAKLVMDKELPFDAFEVNGSSYGVRCTFQVWTRREAPLENSRITSRPPTTHEDFDTWVVSSKPESKRRIKEADWDYAVICQGFKGDFEVIPKGEAHRLSPKKQYMLVKPKSKEAKDKLLSVDYAKLASKNTTKVMGFGKADLVAAYGAPE